MVMKILVRTVVFKDPLIFLVSRVFKLCTDDGVLLQTYSLFKRFLSWKKFKISANYLVHILFLFQYEQKPVATGTSIQTLTASSGKPLQSWEIYANIKKPFNIKICLSSFFSCRVNEEVCVTELFISTVTGCVCVCVWDCGLGVITQTSVRDSLSFAASAVQHNVRCHTQTCNNSVSTVRVLEIVYCKTDFLSPCLASPSHYLRPSRKPVKPPLCLCLFFLFLHFFWNWSLWHPMEPHGEKLWNMVLW